MGEWLWCNVQRYYCNSVRVHFDLVLPMKIWFVAILTIGNVTRTSVYGNCWFVQPTKFVLDSPNNCLLFFFTLYILLRLRKLLVLNSHFCFFCLSSRSLPNSPHSFGGLIRARAMVSRAKSLPTALFTPLTFWAHRQLSAFMQHRNILCIYRSHDSLIISLQLGASSWSLNIELQLNLARDI